jgi:alpha-1,6-mannosyltransferase
MPPPAGAYAYLDAKHRRLALKPGIRHSLLIPGAHLSERDGIFKVPAPLPFGKGYRFPLRLAPGEMSCAIYSQT